MTTKKTATKKTATKKTAPTPRHVLVGNKSYGLYIGVTTASDTEIITSASIRLSDCRHVCRWYGREGGITSLAAHGICGPQASESRIGAPCEALLTGVVNVLDLTPEAVATFAAVKNT